MTIPSPMTVSTFIRVTPVRGKEQELLSWFGQIAMIASGFEGYQGSETFQTLQPGEPSQWLNVFSFNTMASVQKWLSSEERAEILASGSSLFEQSIQRRQMIGIESWFEDKGPQTHPPLPKWEMVVVSSVIILILSHTAVAWLDIILVMLNLPIWLIDILSVMTMIILMTYVIMPGVSRVLNRCHIL